MEDTMRTSNTMILMAAAVMSFSGVASAECMKVTGKGIGVTPDIAKFMASKALKDAIGSRGLKAAGSASMTCDSGLVVMSNCSSAQRACK